MEGKMIRLGAVCLLAAVPVAGCATGSSRSADGAQTIMVSAAAKSEAASTFHISATESTTAVTGTPTLASDGATLAGDVDLSTHSAHITANLAVGVPGTPAKDASFEVIEIGHDSWTSTTGLGGLLGSGSVPAGHWIKDNSSSSISQMPDPGRMFEALRSKATDVQMVGTARINGVACDEYQLVGPPDLLDSLGGAPSDQSAQTGPVTVQVWVDHSNLVRRLRTTVQQDAGAPGQVESMKITVDFTSYGEHLHIVPPPSNLVLPNGTGG